MKGIVSSGAVLRSGHVATGPTGSMLALTPKRSADRDDERRVGGILGARCAAAAHAPLKGLDERE